MSTINQPTIGEIVAEDYRAATVFQSYGIDFCCKGGRSIEDACAAKQIDPTAIHAALAEAQRERPAGQTDYKSWPLDLLADYIEKTHHRYVEERLPAIMQYLRKLCKVHGHAQPELLEITELFEASMGELGNHMKKEELILFPFIRRMVQVKSEGQTLEEPHFGTVENPVRMMMHEHDTEGERFRKIAELSSQYTPPPHACNTYRVTYALLDEFEQDLHLHIHLENNILFPKAIELEAELQA